MASTPVVQPGDWYTASEVASLSSALGEPAAVLAHRKEAFDAFQALPVELNPLYKQYSYFVGVDLRGTHPTTRGPRVRLPSASPSEVLLVHDAEGTHLTAPEEMVKAGLRVSTLPSLLTSSDREAFLRAGAYRAEKFTALNSALFNRGVLLQVPDGFPAPVRVKDITVLSRPEEALLVRRVIRTGRETQVCYSEELYSTQESSTQKQRLYSSVVHATTGERSQLVYLTVHAPDATAVSTYAREAATGPGSHLGWVWAGFGGLRTTYRNDTRLSSPGSEVDDLQTLYGDQHSAYNNYVDISHDQDDTRGQSITRAVFRDHARGTARGMMRIQPNTKKVVSYLSEHGMLLSKTSRCETCPDLEILSSNDVKATHSSSVAPIDPERIFYLESRGIPEASAKRMIAEGFLSYVLDRAPVEGLREALFPTLDARWRGQPVLWGEEGTLPALPPLQITGWARLDEWRLDTKMRDAAGRD